MKYIKTAILIAGMAAATAACTRKPVAPQFGMLSIDTLIGTPANGCKIEYRFATIANAEKSPALRCIEAANDDELAERGFFPEYISLTENFRITPEGITFYYNPYDIGCYALGAVDVTMSREELENL